MSNKTRCAALADRLDHEMNIVDSIRQIAAPTGKTLFGALPVLQVLELALEGHRRALQQIRCELVNAK